MDRLTQKERAQLEDVFAAIYANRQSKFGNFYSSFYKKAIGSVDKITAKIKNKAMNFKKLNFKHR